jgi:AcrR family transcriptional regulator
LARQATQKPRQTAERPASTRDALLMTALEEFARIGVAAASIAQITQKAGARNSSALHYHFGSKDELIRRLVGFVQDWFDQTRQANLAALEAQRRSGVQVTLEQALRWFIEPYVRIITEEPWGLAAVRFLALVQLEQNEAGWAALRERGEPSMRRLLGWVQAARGAPRTDPDGAARLLFFTNAVIQGFAAHRHLEESFIGDMRQPDIASLGAFYMECGRRLLG